MPPRDILVDFGRVLGGVLSPRASWKHRASSIGRALAQGTESLHASLCDVGAMRVAPQESRACEYVLRACIQLWLVGLGFVHVRPRVELKNATRWGWHIVIQSNTNVISRFGNCYHNHHHHHLPHPPTHHTKKRSPRDEATTGLESCYSAIQSNPSRRMESCCSSPK